MEISCPKCGEIITISNLGRKKLNISVINIRDALDKHKNKTQAALFLGCSRAYIYKALKDEQEEQTQEKTAVL